MNQDPYPTRPAGQAGYVPYFYQSGRFVAYPITARKNQTFSEPAGPLDYNFATFQPADPFVSHPNTVEQVVARGYLAVPRADPSTALLTDKRMTSGLGLDDLIGQIRRRYDIYDQNLYEIEQAKCSAVNSLHSVQADRGSMPANSKEVYGLSKALQRLYQQQLDERVRLWQDVSRLRLAMPETAQQYLSVYRKVQLLNDTAGDRP